MGYNKSIFNLYDYLDFNLKEKIVSGPVFFFAKTKFNLSSLQKHFREFLDNNKNIFSEEEKAFLSFPKRGNKTSFTLYEHNLIYCLGSKLREDYLKKDFSFGGFRVTGIYTFLEGDFVELREIMFKEKDLVFCNHLYILFKKYLMGKYELNSDLEFFLFFSHK